MKIAIGCATPAFSLKEAVKKHLIESEHDVIDFMPLLENTPAYYPDAACGVAKAVSDGSAEAGILLCGTGMGMSIVANSYKGVRAAVVESLYSAKACRAINGANVLCIGSYILGERMALSMVEAFLTTEFSIWPKSNPDKLKASLKRIVEIDAENHG